MQQNDLLLFNLHKRYLNVNMDYGGFSGIYIISAFVEENGFSAQAYAGSLMAGKKLLDEACLNKQVKVIGLYCDYENITENIFFSRYIKENYHLPVLIGGPQATALGEEFFLRSGCDAVVRYEGELTVLELLQYFVDGFGALEEIQGIAYYKAGRVCINEDRPVIENLDMLPFVDKKYSIDEQFRDNHAAIMTGRGCPFNCAFCHEGHHTRKVRFRSVASVLEEVDKFLEQLPASGGYILFTDDTFTLIPNRVKELCQGLSERRKRYTFRWFCEGHIHTLFLHPEMIDYIAQGGAQRIQLGIEAGTQRILDCYRKGSTLDEIRTVVYKCRDAGISQIFSNIILGGPFFSKEIFEKDLAFAKELIKEGKGTVEIGVVSYWPLAETSITMHPAEYGINILDYDFYTSSGDFPQVESDALDVWEICSLVHQMRSEINELMLDMLRKDEIPLALIRKWFDYFHSYSTAGAWLEVMSLDRHLYNYYEFISSGEVIPWQELEGDISNYYPMRVTSLYDHCDKVNDIIVLYDIIEEQLDREVLRYCAGKLSVQQIITRIVSLHHLDVDKAQEEIRNIIVLLAKKHLLVFSLY